MIGQCCDGAASTTCPAKDTADKPLGTSLGIWRDDSRPDLNLHVVDLRLDVQITDLGLDLPVYDLHTSPTTFYMAPLINA